jgi:hypothetical protein
MQELRHGSHRPTERPSKQVARIVGLLFVLTFITSIAGLILYGPVLNDADYITGGGADSRVTLGAFFEIGLVITNIGTALVLFPVLKHTSESLALGYVASRVVESMLIAVGAISLLSIVTLRQDSGADAAALLVQGESLVAVHDWTFLLGPGFCVGIGNGILLGYLMWKSQLVPRRMAMLGLIGGPVILASSIAVLFGAYEQTGPVHFLFSVPEIAWEALLGIYLLVKGFKTSPILDAGRQTGLDDAFGPAVAAP